MKNKATNWEKILVNLISEKVNWFSVEVPLTVNPVSTNSDIIYNVLKYQNQEIYMMTTLLTEPSTLNEIYYI